MSAPFSPASRQCVQHPQRSAFALCMSCRNPLCQECVTQWDGIYHCASCLAAKRSTANVRGGIAGWLLLAAGTLLCLFCGAHVMVWIGARIAGLF